jgi:hypothetical protein
LAKNATPKTVIRGGFGIFYDRFSEQNVLLAQRRHQSAAVRGHQSGHVSGDSIAEFARKLGGHR